jgi:hypothetical protein
LDEINLLLSAKNSAKQYYAFAFVSDSTEHSPESHQQVRERLWKLVRNIPSAGELRSQSRSPYPQGPTKYYYRTRYAVYSLPCTDSLSRPAVLTNVASLLGFMSTWQLRIRAALPARCHTEHDRLYESTVTAFDAWLAIARPLVSPAISTLRNRENSGVLKTKPPRAAAGTPRTSRLPQLLEQLFRSA